jgi:DNA-binding protein YbaB
MRKIRLNKRTLMISSSLAAIPLTIALIAAVSHRGRRHNLLQSRGSLVQTRSKMSVITSTDSHIQKEKTKGQQPQSSLQGSETAAATMTTTTATISTSTTVADKDVITAPGVVPSPMAASSTSDSAEIVSSPPSQTSREEEISVSDEAGKTGESLKELIVTAIKEAKDSANGTGERLKQQPINIATTADSKDIHSLEDNVDAVLGLFEETMVKICRAWQESKTIMVMVTTTAIDNPKDAPTVVAPPMMVSTSGFDNTVISSSYSAMTQTPKEQEISISDDAKKAGESLKEWIAAAVKDAKDSAKGTKKQPKEETIGNAAPTNSKDIQSMGDTINTLIELFEKTMIEIRKEGYNEQIKLLQSYKDLLQTQSTVVKARGTMARKLKPGA